MLLDERGRVGSLHNKSMSAYEQKSGRPWSRPATIGGIPHSRLVGGFHRGCLPSWSRRFWGVSIELLTITVATGAVAALACFASTLPLPSWAVGEESSALNPVRPTAYLSLTGRLPTPAATAVGTSGGLMGTPTLAQVAWWRSTWPRRRRQCLVPSSPGRPHGGGFSPRA